MVTRRKEFSQEMDLEMDTRRKAISQEQQENSKKGKVKRYNLVLPNSLFDEVQILANDEKISVLELLKRFIKIGLVLTKFARSPNARLILREGDRERELVLL